MYSGAKICPNLCTNHLLPSSCDLFSYLSTCVQSYPTGILCLFSVLSSLQACCLWIDHEISQSLKIIMICILIVSFIPFLVDLQSFSHTIQVSVKSNYQSNVGQATLELFQQMHLEGVQLNSITFMGCRSCAYLLVLSYLKMVDPLYGQIMVNIWHSNEVYKQLRH